ncbi:MAG: DUF4097 family beta strand repeat protein [Candidatus Aminicenantes bacterium]|nr:DUF4097 family beta strand repeat protein [Candidatus Aminicenantes bacterium]
MNRTKRSTTFFAMIMVLAISLCSSCVINGDGEFFSIFSGPKYEEEFHKTVPLERGGDFILRNVNGSIIIETWDREEVEITAVKTARGNKNNLDRVQIKIDVSDQFVEIDTIYEKRRNLRVSVSYQVLVPENINLELIRTVNGSIKMKGPFSDVKAVSTNGGIQLEEAAGYVSLSSTNGSIKAYELKGNIHTGTTNGSILLEIRSLTDDVTAKTVNGGIKLAFDDFLDADLNLRTSNGKIHVDFPITVENLRKSRRSLEGRIGKGGPEISLKTVNGSIKLISLDY